MEKEAVRMKPERMMEFLRPRKLRKMEDMTKPRMASSGGSDTIQDTVSGSRGAPDKGWLTPVPLTLPFKLEQKIFTYFDHCRSVLVAKARKRSDLKCRDVILTELQKRTQSHA